MVDRMMNVLTLVAIACICAVTWAVCQKLGLWTGDQILVPSGVCGISLLVWLASMDGLDPLERTCRDELLKTTRMEGVADLRIENHYDFWTKTFSGGGFVMPWISEPYQTPKVSLTVTFTRDKRPRSAWIDCVFSKVPNTGEPPQVSFHDIKIYETVLERTSGSQSR
jgi:hypothetical protein